MRKVTLKLPPNQKSSIEECTRAMGKYHFKHKNKFKKTLTEAV